MSSLQPRVYVENLPEKRFAAALLRSYAVEVIDGLTTSGTVALAELSLLEHPERHVAVLLNAPAGDWKEGERIRATVKRILARAAPEGWYVGVAIPRLVAWAMTDPRIKQDFESYLEGKANYIDRAVRIGELTKNQPFDPTELYRKSEYFRGLVEFLQRHSPAPSR
jgi:hypothetical protein